MSDEDREQQLYAAMNSRIEKAAAGQPFIVRKAMLEGGVCRCRVDLSPREVRQLYRAVKADLLMVVFTGPLGRTKMFVCNPTIAFGGTP